MVSLKLTRTSKAALAIAAIFILALGVNWLTAPSLLVRYEVGTVARPPVSTEVGAVKADLAGKRSALESLGFLALNPTTTIPPTVTEQASPLASVRMEIFSASMSVEVKDVKSALTKVASLAQQLGGFVAGTSASVFGEDEVVTIIIKVPKENFFQVVNAVESLGKLKDLQTRSDDVTEEFIDLKARRDNLQKQEERLVEILKLGNTVDDVLKVERELERVRGEIERLTGRINFLERNVEMSSVMVTLSKPGVEKAPEFDWTEPFRTGLGFLYAVVRGLVISAFIVAPFAVIGTPAYFAYRYRKSKNSKLEPIASSKSV